MPNNEAPASRLLNLEGIDLPRGNYYLEKLVSVSNMSVIYKAVDRSSQRYVAVKILLNPRYFQRFRNEVNITWGQKNNIASAIRYDLDGERLPDGAPIRYFVMKWLSGPSLAERIRTFRMEQRPTREVLDFSVRLLSKLAPALDEMHRIGIVHQDIKPSNILFNSDEFENDEPYLIDFGIAQWMQRMLDDMTVVEVEEVDAPEASENFVEKENPGTANYMPPEQWAGRVNSGATDQYALAITIYETLSGRISPYQEVLDALESTTSGTGGSARREVWRKAHETEPPTPIQRYRPEVPKAVWRVLLKAMDKDTHKRYRSVMEFYNAFQATAQQPLEAAIPYKEFDRTRPDTYFRQRSRRTIPLILAAAALVLIAGAGAIILGTRTNDDIPSTAIAAALTETLDPTAEVAALAITAEMTALIEATVAATQGKVITDTPNLVPTETITPAASATTAPSDTPMQLPSSTPTSVPDTVTPTNTTAPSVTPTLTETATPTAPPTATQTPSPTATYTATASPTLTPSTTPTPTAIPTSTPVPLSTVELLTQISDAGRSANNFNCVAFLEAYEALALSSSGLSADEQSAIAPLFERSSPLIALSQFCAAPNNVDDETAQLPSNLANDEFRDLRTLIRTTILAVQGL